MDRAFSFIISNGGIASEAKYPYVGTQGVCDATKLPYHAASISGYVDVPPYNERALKFAVAYQPVSVAIDASGLDFQLYTSGIFSGPCGTDLDHAVTVVGYGRNKYGTKYWIVKNSWGTWWGDHGYIYMERDVVDPEGLCGIALAASYPIV